MLRQFGESFNKLLEKMGGWLDTIILGLPNFILAAIVLALSVSIARHLKNFAEKAVKNTGANRTVAGLLANIVVSVFMLVSLFVILNILDLSDALTALLGTAGVAGLAVGLALQDPMMNLFSGVLMSVRDHYKIGDLVETNGFLGRIQKINLRSILLLTQQGQEIVIPNKEVLQSPLINYSSNGQRRIDINCGVSYADDLEKVRRVAIEAIKNSAIPILELRAIRFFYTSFGGSSIDFKICFWISTQSDFIEVQSEAIIALKKAFDENNITIPFPITTLDFGVEGGIGIDELYPPSKIFNFPIKEKKAV